MKVHICVMIRLTESQDFLPYTRQADTSFVPRVDDRLIAEGWGTAFSVAGSTVESVMINLETEEAHVWLHSDDMVADFERFGFTSPAEMMLGSYIGFRQMRDGEATIRLLPSIDGQ